LDVSIPAALQEESVMCPYVNDPLTEKIIGCALKVSNGLGHGFIEKVYENALAHDLRKAGIAFEKQKPIEVVYDEEVVGDFQADLLVQETVIVELKAVKDLTNDHMTQCLNYLKATGLKTGLLLNFGKEHLEIKRISL
jgi:GxxExxY protein